MMSSDEHNTQAGAVQQALQEARSVLLSINHSDHHKIQRGGEDVYWQRGEWCTWAINEVLPLVDAALAQPATPPSAVADDDLDDWRGDCMAAFSHLDYESGAPSEVLAALRELRRVVLGEPAQSPSAEAAEVVEALEELGRTLSQGDILNRAARVIRGLAAVQSAAKRAIESPWGWAVVGSQQIWRGPYAQQDAEREARHIGGTCKAFALYATPQPSA